MKRMMRMVVVATAVCVIGGVASAAEPKKGEELFKQHCAVCHPNGGNIINQKKTLKKDALKANGIASAKDIVKYMRNPGQGMNKFDEKTVSDKDAKVIAEYILKTFK